VRAQLDRGLDRWTRRNPDLEVRAVVVHGSIIGTGTSNIDASRIDRNPPSHLEGLSTRS
jgi:hypothetical protein